MLRRKFPKRFFMVRQLFTERYYCATHRHTLFPSHALRETLRT